MIDRRSLALISSSPVDLIIWRLILIICPPLMWLSQFATPFHSVTEIVEASACHFHKETSLLPVCHPLRGQTPPSSRASRPADAAMTKWRRWSHFASAISSSAGVAVEGHLRQQRSLWGADSAYRWPGKVIKRERERMEIS